MKLNQMLSFCSELCNGFHFPQNKSQSPSNGLKGPPRSGPCQFSDIILCYFPSSSFGFSHLGWEYTCVLLPYSIFLCLKCSFLGYVQGYLLTSFRSLLTCNLFNEIYPDHFISHIFFITQYLWPLRTCCGLICYAYYRSSVSLARM